MVELGLRSEDRHAVGRWLARARSDVRLYQVIIRARTRSEMSYRTSFALRFFANLFVSLLDFVSIWFVMSKVRTLGGWDAPRVAFLYGMSSTSFRVMDLLIGGVESGADMVRTGGFDRYLVRPIGALTQLAGDFFNVRRIGTLVQSVAVLAWSLAHLPIEWTAAKVAFLAAALAGGFLISAGLFVATCSVGFWSPNSAEFANAFNYGGNTMASYPIHVMRNWVRFFAFSLVPVGFCAYLPSFVLFDAPNPLGVPRWLSYASPLACVPVVCVAAFIWRAALRHYSSTGS